ncbi:hypothetical protein IVB18_35480 [Bradyrhizobium sp. 186]|uniref:hypothetical protein n=1 Tax=Bradyrhizobium sp. 186 TaxID=2782654 RepID=UPI0020015B61|nr:hypothetical protein [Bradyrhizobium sp. 186]UPK33474.1 hypothetical protein IVB18_35480 [Bradyrhizobium sp. 186]
MAATSLAAGYGTSFVDAALGLKCPFALDAIARRYRAAIGASYRTDWGSAFPPVRDPAFDGRAPDWRAFTSIRRSIP